MRTPAPRARELAAEGTPFEAIKRAWLDPGPHPQWHRDAQKIVREAMPVLAAALDRVERERLDDARYDA